MSLCILANGLELASFACRQNLNLNGKRNDPFRLTHAILGRTLSHTLISPRVRSLH
jgi:hypothetical protein